jgi:hypothetical protein
MNGLKRRNLVSAWPLLRLERLSLPDEARRVGRSHGRGSGRKTCSRSKPSYVRIVGCFTAIGTRGGAKGGEPGKNEIDRKT